MSETISDATAEAFVQQMQSRGIDGTAALARFGRGPDGRAVQQQAPAAPAPQAPPAFPSDLSPSKLPSFSSSELEQAADTLSRHWTGDPAVLRDALLRAGLAEHDTATDPRSDLERGFDATVGAPASPDEYSLADLWVNRADSPIEDRAEATVAIREALAEMGVPKMLGSAAAGYLLDGIAQWDTVKADPVKAQQYHMEQQALACRVLGTGWQDVVDTIKPVVARLGADNKALFAPAGAFEHASLLVWLYRSAELLAARKGMELHR